LFGPLAAIDCHSAYCLCSGLLRYGISFVIISCPHALGAALLFLFELVADPADFSAVALLDVDAPNRGDAQCPPLVIGEPQELGDAIGRFGFANNRRLFENARRLGGADWASQYARDVQHRL